MGTLRSKYIPYGYMEPWGTAKGAGSKAIAVKARLWYVGKRLIALASLRTSSSGPTGFRLGLRV